VEISLDLDAVSAACPQCSYLARRSGERTGASGSAHRPDASQVPETCPQFPNHVPKFPRERGRGCGRLMRFGAKPSPGLKSRRVIY